MALIKQSDATRLVKSAIVFDLGDVDREAKQLIDDARAEARSIVERAGLETRRDHDASVEQGRQEGVEQGTKRGLEEGRAAGRDEVLESFRPQVEQLVESWQQALEQWQTQRREMLHGARQDVLAFAFEFARKVVHRIIEADASVAQRQIESALALVSRPSALEIAVNPADRAVVEAVLPELAARIGECLDVSLRDDDGMTRGGCVVRTVGGVIDGTIETQIERIAEALLPADRGPCGPADCGPRGPADCGPRGPAEPPAPSGTDAEAADAPEGDGAA